MNTHICLLSGDLMPNIIGVLHDRAECVVPVVTRESEHLIETFRDALAASGAQVTFGHPATVSAFDLADCLKTFRQLAKRYPRAVFNWTGGTKVMSYAARRVAEQARARALYVLSNSRDILIEDLRSRQTRVDTTDAARLGLNILVHLHAAGHKVEHAATLQEFRSRYCPARQVVDAATVLFDATPTERQDLHRLARAEDQPVRPVHLNPHFLYLLSRARLIQPALQPGEYFLSALTYLPCFHMESPQRANARFLQAGYLEVFLWSQIKERSEFEEVGWSVRLNPGQQGRTMELDVVVAGEGRLLVLEAKTSVEVRQLGDLIEEQASRCRRIGGAWARWILYVHRFRSDHSDAETQAILASAEARARDFGGRLLWHDDLSELPDILTKLLTEPGPVL